MICSLGVSNFYMLAALLLVTLLLRRAFCGYVCPIGTISEWLGVGARRLGLKPAVVLYRVDRGFAALKYAVLAIILYFTWRYAELEFRVADPCYALISRHGEDITVWAYVVAAAIVLGSLVVTMPFCRWVCPLAAVLHPVSRFGLTRVKRDLDVCTSCGLCSRVCPTAIPVAQVREVKAARCLSCLSCMDACPRGGQGAISWGPPNPLGRSWPQAVLVAILLSCMTAGVGAVYAFPLPSYTEVIEGRGDAPPETVTTELGIHNLACRGKASLLTYFVGRDDEYQISGYIKIEAWPGAGLARARITYDPTKTDEEAIKEAITEPYYDDGGGLWRMSPFEIEGYDLLRLEERPEADVTSP
jgi:ferredoxin